MPYNSIEYDAASLYVCIYIYDHAAAVAVGASASHHQHNVDEVNIYEIYVCIFNEMNENH